MSNLKQEKMRELADASANEIAAIGNSLQPLFDRLKQLSNDISKVEEEILLFESIKKQLENDPELLDIINNLITATVAKIEFIKTEKSALESDNGFKNLKELKLTKEKTLQSIVKIIDLLADK